MVKMSEAHLDHGSFILGCYVAYDVVLAGDIGVYLYVVSKVLLHTHGVRVDTFMLFLLGRSFLFGGVTHLHGA